MFDKDEHHFEDSEVDKEEHLDKMNSRFKVESHYASSAKYIPVMSEIITPINRNHTKHDHLNEI